ncbi:cysteine hydrolase [Luteimonas sp. BDR2-5]|uniref:cysteine hydrolase family protein n=1 Tax=Proluteimonas luteida TaxID=2878685 RepID=UPI001E5EBCB7|nr:isochorismatase family cysteine hydrolase [Luteimonas sp. BDR2-5]MCD9026710.1 cysteine hydrolase [Luteimonas sp. BDR2-5]
METFVGAVVLIIDMQVDFFAHERLSRQRAGLVSDTNALIAAARKSEAPIVWVRQEFSPDLSDATLEVKRENIAVVIAGTPGAAMLPELDVSTSDHTIVKRRYSAFFGTNLDDFLASAGCSSLIVAGINTHACVRTTVVDAYQRDYEVILARDCIASHDKEHHDVTWRYMDGKLGHGMSNQQIFALLAQVPSNNSVRSFPSTPSA